MYSRYYSLSFEIMIVHDSTILPPSSWKFALISGFKSLIRASRPALRVEPTASDQVFGMQKDQTGHLVVLLFGLLEVFMLRVAYPIPGNGTEFQPKNLVDLSEPGNHTASVLQGLKPFQKHRLRAETSQNIPVLSSPIYSSLLSSLDIWLCFDVFNSILTECQVPIHVSFSDYTIAPPGSQLLRPSHAATLPILWPPTAPVGS